MRNRTRSRPAASVLHAIIGEAAWACALAVVVMGCRAPAPSERAPHGPGAASSAEVDELRALVAELNRRLQELEQTTDAAPGREVTTHAEPKSVEPEAVARPEAVPEKVEPARPTGEGAREQRIRDLVEDLGSRNIIRQYNSAVELRSIGKPAVPQLLAALRHENQRTRHAAAVLLSKMREQTAVPPLVAQLRTTEDAGEKLVLAAALGKLRDKRAVPALLEELESEDWRLQAACARALGRVEDARAVPALADLLEAKNEHVRGAAAHALKEIGEEGIPELRKAFGNASGSARVHLIAVLERIGGEQGMAELRRALSDVNLYVRLAAARSLARMGRPDGLGAANEALSSESAQTRKFAMEVIRLLGDSVAVDPATGRYMVKKP